MKLFILNIERLPKWYGVSIVLIYGILFAEYTSTIARLLIIDESLIIFHAAFLKINYFVVFLTSIILWLIITFLFHITALLFNGNSSFGRFLRISSYLCIIQTIILSISIFILDGMQNFSIENLTQEMLNNPLIQLAKYLMNSSFILCYLITAIFIHYIYKIKLVYGILSVVIPVASIWVASQLFTWLL